MLPGVLGVYRIGAMAHAIDFVAPFEARCALLANIFNDTRHITPQDTTKAARATGVVKISRVYSYSDRFDLVVAGAHGLLRPFNDSSYAILLDNDGLHADWDEVR